MNKNTGGINNIQEGQRELFSEFPGTGRNKFAHFKKKMALDRKITLSVSHETLALFFIALIMLIVVFFSLGVERGKRVAIKWAAAHADRVNKK